MSESALWQEILTAPGEENLKALYIKELARTGDPRAEVFRLAEELRKYPVYYAQHEGIARQYESSLTAWREALAASAKAWQAQIAFVQGWPVEITLAARDFLHHAAGIVATIPLRHLNLTEVAEAPEVFAIPPFEQIASLHGGQQRWGREAIVALAASTHLHSLRWLDLTYTRLTDAEVEILAASPNLRGLAHVDVRDNPCHDPVDAAAGYGVDGVSGYIVAESIYLPEFGRELEARYGTIDWLNALANFREQHPPSRYQF